MITRAYCVMMARYNRWQNVQLESCLAHLPDAELTQDRGAFFGSIMTTLSHLCWGDHIWLSRFDGGDGPPVPASEHGQYAGSLAAWRPLRDMLDQRIADWADGVTDDVLAGDLIWYSGLNQCDMRTPMAQAATHFFNHQTHHRGQIHAMITSTGAKAPVSDLAFMPEEF
ncbi:MAG: DinB family protein [Arenibacterium sp.]